MSSFAAILLRHRNPPFAFATEGSSWAFSPAASPSSATASMVPRPACSALSIWRSCPAHAIGKQQIASKDGTEVGWIAGDDILDIGFDLAKNVVNDTLHFALRVDTQKLPADLLRAYARAELEALAAQNPSGRPSVVQKKQARDAAREKLEAEAKDGRYLRRKAYPVLWDGPSNSLLVGTTSATVGEGAGGEASGGVGWT